MNTCPCCAFFLGNASRICCSRCRSHFDVFVQMACERWFEYGETSNWSALMLERMQTSMDHHHHLLFSIILKQIFGIYGIIHIIVNIALAWRFNCISKSIKCRKLMKTKICHYLKQLKLNLVLLLLIHIKF